MQIQVDYMLFKTLVESISKIKSLQKQDTETQNRWIAVINETEVVALRALKEFNAANGYNDGRTETGMGPIISPDKTPYV